MLDAVSAVQGAERVAEGDSEMCAGWGADDVLQCDVCVGTAGTAGCGLGCGPCALAP